MNPFDRSNRLLARQSDLLLAAGVVLILGTLIIPIPTWLMDALIATNLSVAVLVLLTAYYISEPGRLPSFPTILLLTTLFRLALNVSSTRLILLQADAGEIITAFGNFVVRGNLVVGAVVFLVLTLVQFIVIAKGSERVAEVAARFALDAIGGKQMAIDSDLRANLIDESEARRRRRELDRENKLYGAMDGAMKFVKGDAIAGICIALINIVGGLIVGVTQQGMTAREAAQVYSLLTIGDGLVSQIPSIVICVAAGLVVTRVAADPEDREANVAADVVQQFMAQPRALAFTALLLFALACISVANPNTLPWWPFAGIAAAVGAAAFVAARGVPGTGPAKPEATPVEESRRPRLSVPHQVVLAMHPTFSQRIRPGLDDASLRELLEDLRLRAAEATGVPFAHIEIAMTERLVPTGGYAVLAYGAPIHSETPAPAARNEDPSLIRTAVIARATAALRRHAHEFVGLQETQEMLDSLKQTHPDLVQKTVPNPVTAPLLADVLRRLLREQVSVRNLRMILESLSVRVVQTKELAALTELVRQDIRRTICQQLATDDLRLQYLTVDPKIVEIVAPALRNTPNGSISALKGEDKRRLAECVQKAASSARWAGPSSTPILVVPSDRLALRTALQDLMPEVAVLSNSELAPGFRQEIAGFVQWEAETDARPTAAAAAGS